MSGDRQKVLTGSQRLATIGVLSGGVIVAVAALSVSLVYGRVIDRLVGGFLTPLVGTLMLGLVLWPLVWFLEHRLKRAARELPGLNPVMLIRVAFSIATLIGLCLIASAWIVAWAAGVDLRQPLPDALILVLVGSVAFVSLPLIAAGYALELLRLSLILLGRGNSRDDKAI